MPITSQSSYIGETAYKENVRMRKSEYQKRQEGEATVFEVTPAKAPKLMLPLVGGIGFTIFGYFFYDAEIGFFFFYAGIVFIVLAWFLDWRPRAHKKKSTFRVTPNVIEAKGRTFNKDDIHRLIIKNGVSHKIAGASNILTTDKLTNVTIAANSAYLEKLSRVANSLDLETGGKAYMLAGGMDETTAFGLLKDVCKVIGFSV